MVVPSRRAGPLERTRRSLLASGDHAGARLQIIVAWWGTESPPDVHEASVVRSFPLSAAYLWNRAFERATSPLVAFLPGAGRVSQIWASSVLAAYDRAPAPGGVHGPVEYAGEVRSEPREKGLETRSGSAPSPEVRARDRILPEGGHLALRRRELRRLGGFHQLWDPVPAGTVNGRTPSAVELLFHIRDAGKRVLFLPEMAVRLEHAGPGVVRAFREGAVTAEACRRMGRGRVGAGHAARRLFAAALPAPSAPGSRRRALAEAAGVTFGMLSSLRRRPAIADPAPHLPEALSRRLDPESLVPHPGSSRSKSHFLYETGDGRILHWYLNPPSRLRRSLAERERIRSRASVDGIPRLHHAARGGDSAWVLEDRVPGAPLRPASRPAWFPEVLEWAVGMAGPPGAPLGTLPSWNRLVRRLLRATPAPGRRVVTAALERVEPLHAVHMHGDFRPANILRTPDGKLGAVDWAGAWLRGLPGLDLCFLALWARGGEPDGSVLQALMEGREPPAGPLFGHLDRVGLPGEDVPAAVTVMLAIWAMEEKRRRSRIGSPPPPPQFGPLLLRHAAV